MNRFKVFNDPIHGFISIESALIFKLIEHPWFQRLRRIKQLGLTDYVYPGAIHTRFHHAIGAYHIMRQALWTLRRKGHEISKQEEEAALIAILLHDMGHGPFSHTLEKCLIPEVNPLEAIVPYVETMIAHRFSKERLTEDLFYNAVTLSHLAGRIPMSLTQFLDDLDQQRFEITSRVVEDQSTIDAADRRQNRFILALLSITGAVCGTAALSWDGFPPYGNLVLASVFYAVAIPLFFFTLVMTLRNRG